MEDLNKEDELKEKLSRLNLQIRQTKLEVREMQEKYKDLEK